MSTAALTGSAPSPVAGEAGGQNAGGRAASVSSATLEAALAKAMIPQTAETNSESGPVDDTSAPTEAVTETVPEPETNSESEPQPAEAGESSETDLSQSQDSPPQLPPELAALPEDVRAQLVELAKEVAEGKTSFGQIKRGHRLSEEIQQLQQELEEAKKAPPVPAANAGLHPEVAKLKSEAEVQQKRLELKQLVRECRANFNGYTDANGNEVPADRIQRILADAENQLDDLQDRAMQLTQQAQIKQTQASVEKQVRQHAPEFFDSKTPLGQKFAVLVNDPLIASLPNRHFAAACYALGEQTLMARLNKTTAPAAAPAKPAPKPGTVPKAKPAVSSGGGAPAKPDAGKARLEAALPKPGSKVKSDDLERVLAAMPTGR